MKNESKIPKNTLKKLLQINPVKGGMKEGKHIIQFLLV